MENGQIIEGTMGFCLFTRFLRVFNPFKFKHRKLNA